MEWTACCSHRHDLGPAGASQRVIEGRATVGSRRAGHKQGKRRVSLGLKQTQKNPWDQIEERFPGRPANQRQDY